MLSVQGLVASMNAAGTWMRTPMESFFGTLKSELVHHCDYLTRDEARGSIYEYVETFYNGCRRHSSLDYLAPEAYERRLALEAAA